MNFDRFFRLLDRARFLTVSCVVLVVLGLLTSFAVLLLDGTAKMIAFSILGFLFVALLSAVLIYNRTITTIEAMDRKNPPRVARSTPRRFVHFKPPVRLVPPENKKDPR